MAAPSSCRPQPNRLWAVEPGGQGAGWGRNSQPPWPRPAGYWKEKAKTEQWQLFWPSDEGEPHGEHNYGQW